MAIAASKTLKWTVLAAAVALIAGCAKKDDAISQADKKDLAQGVPAPSIAETKAIAEEGFIYGLPLVMNYAVMNEFAVDTKSSQFKAPFNEINNQHRVATYEDTAVITPNSDTPYSMLWSDLRAEPLGKLIHDKTAGNPFFAIQFLLSWPKSPCSPSTLAKGDGLGT